jgi:hypothetical protein
MTDSKFSEGDIEGVRREATKKNLHEKPRHSQAMRDILDAAKTETPIEFQGRLLRLGIDLKSDQAKRIMEQYWIIHRERSR